MRRYQPLTKPDGRVPHSTSHHTNPYYGTHGADWVKNTNASLFNAKQTHSLAKRETEQRVSQRARQLLWLVLAIIAMVLGGFILFSLAINF